MEAQPVRARTKTMDWTDDRCDELRMLRELLSEARTLNHGSNIIGRIQRCEELAEKLGLTDMNIPKDSFINFLFILARKDRVNSSAPSSPPE